MKVILADAGATFRARRLVLTLYPYRGLTLSEIGDVLGVTEPRLSDSHEGHPPAPRLARERRPVR